jgi:hypothetical protein
MSASTRVNPVAAYTNSDGVDTSGHTHGVLFSVMQLKAFVIDCGATLAGQGGIGGAIEAVFREVQPLMFQSVSTSGVIHVIVDGHAVDATTLAARIAALGTVNGYSFAGATVTLGTTVTVS